jgi:hypothetical protein
MYSPNLPPIYENRTYNPHIGFIAQGGLQVAVFAFAKGHKKTVIPCISRIAGVIIYVNYFA